MRFLIVARSGPLCALYRRTDEDDVKFVSSYSQRYPNTIQPGPSRCRGRFQGCEEILKLSAARDSKVRKLPPPLSWLMEFVRWKED